MSEIHTLYRIVESQLGSYAYPVKTFDSQPIADAALQDAVRFWAQLTEGNVVVGLHKVMTVKQMLIELGVATLSHNVLGQKVHGAIVVAPASALIQK